MKITAGKLDQIGDLFRSQFHELALTFSGTVERLGT